MEMEADAEESRPKRQKRDTSYKNKAFEKFKQLRSGGRKYEVEKLESVYDTVDEREYTKKVLARQDDDWIVDDDGSGYVEDGRDIFDDDLDKESLAAASSSKGKGVKRKKKDISQSAGKGKLQFMISNMPSKKKEEVKLDDDEVLAELLGEIDETPGSSKAAPTSTSFSERKAEKNYMKSLAFAANKPTPILSKTTINKMRTPKHTPHSEKPSTSSSTILKEVQNHIPPKRLSFEEDPEDSALLDSLPDTQIDITPLTLREAPQEEDCFGDDIDMDQIADVEEKAWEQIQEEMMKEWGTTNQNDTIEKIINLETSDIPLTEIGDKKVFRFFWWDAFEDPFIQPGVVFLFGKTYHEKTKSYISCSVVVRNINRKLFFLPRITEKNSEIPVSSQDVYQEVNSIMKAKQVKQFKARPINKKFAFDLEVPTESDYIEVRYSAKDPPIAKDTEGRTFSRVFGTETAFLENLLLDRKIKGPCWLDISNPTPVNNPLTWCKLEVDCNKDADITVATEVKGRPPLIVTSINILQTVNPKTASNEIVMISCVTNNDYHVDKQIPTVPFQKHFCVFTCPKDEVLPLDLHASLKDYKATTLQKMESERALLNYFVNQFVKLDSDVIVGHDLQGYQINLLSERLVHHQSSIFSKLGRIKRSILKKQKLERQLFVGRLVCDVKISAKELIKCRSYDLDTLCTNVLQLKDGQRIDFEPEDIQKMFLTLGDIFKLVSLTMQDTAYILKIMYSLNIIPLALQITNIAGNVMSRTLLGGRSERNEFLLLHAFSEKDYIVPDKFYGRKEPSEKTRKKPTYAGGLVLEPKVGLYDSLILLMDFNSLYPSIIQEYNICFTTMPSNLSIDNMVLPDKSLPAGILSTEIRKLVESRREVKKLMNNPDISNDLRMQYHIRQMALKLTANSMYGCLGFSNSRFYAKNLAALITFKGREILTNTRDVVEHLQYEVIYGDTDSLMINTNVLDYEQVFKIGKDIKQEINKLYKQVELDIDGVFRYLLLLKKKKYAAVTLSKTKTGELKSEVEYKGLDIVRRDWSKLASEAGKFALSQILSDKGSDDRADAIFSHLQKLKEDLEAGLVPASLLVITKQLTKNPSLYKDIGSLPHVQVAVRYNKEAGGHLRAGDVVPYIICEDGTVNSATQRGYHVEELKSNSKLKIDVKYYLSQQIHPVVSRICEPIPELDPFQLADCLGVDSRTLKKPQQSVEVVGENITRPEVKFRDVDKFVFTCVGCQTENIVEGPLKDNIPVLEKCVNAECKVRPIDYLALIQNQLVFTMNKYVEKYYRYEMYCEDPMCVNNENRKLPMRFAGRYPVCTTCKNGVMLKKYTENNLYSQLSYFHFVFDLSKLAKKPLLDMQVNQGYQEIKQTIESKLEQSAYSIIKLQDLFVGFHALNKRSSNEAYAQFVDEEDSDDDE